MPTKTHCRLLRLFQKYSPVRIVTTNFDLLFEKALAAHELFDTEIESFHAPALPKGSGFEGVVHVHGSVKRPKEMILTETNFGEAYLAEGSARRFLTALFVHYTVLFIGYSHKDTILNYLARALPPTEHKHYALTPSNEDSEHLEQLKIDRIKYPKSGSDGHQALHDGLEKFVELVNRRPTEWRSEIERIVKKSPDGLGADQNLLQYALKEKMNVKFFTNAAETPDWLDWIDNQGYLDGLYDQNKGDDKTGLWIFWLADNFADSHADRLQYVIGRREGRLHYYLWQRLSYAIQSADLDVSALEEWVSLLLSKIPDSVAPSSHMLSLGKHCADRGLGHAVAQIFDLMLEMRSSVGNYMKDMQPQDLETTWELDFNRIRLQPLYEAHDTCDLWEKSLNPRINQFATLLIDRVVRRLDERHFTLSCWGNANKYFDNALGAMGLIKDLSPGDLGPVDIKSLTICVARDCLDWMVENRREDGAFWQRRLAKSESPLLRALAVHTVRRDTVRRDKSQLPEQKAAAWLLEKNPLLEVKRINDWAPRQELYALAEVIYPRLNEERRRDMIEAIGEYQHRRPDREPNEELDERDRYEWYHRLLQSYPECLLAKEAFEEAQSNRSKWILRPDVGIRVINFSPSSLSAEQLLARQGSEWVSELPALFNQVSEGAGINDSVEGLSEAVKEAAKPPNLDWGIDLARGLADANEWETDVWLGLIQAWAEAGLDKDRYKKILNLIGKENLHGKQERDYFIIRTLDSLAANGGAPYALELLSDTNRIAESLWDKIDDRYAEYLTRYRLNGLQLLLKDTDSAPEGLEQVWAEALSKIALDTSPKGRAGRSALAQRFACLLDYDKAWTEENLLSFFSSTNDDEFREVWKGFLWQGMRLNKETADILYEPSLKAVDKILIDNELSDRFVDYYVKTAIYFIEDPLEKWIPKFFKHSSEENRREFTRGLGNLIRLSYLHKQEAELNSMWNRWIKRYWNNRLLGVPRPLDENEIGKMFSWPIYFGSVFPEAVELAVQMEPTSAQEAVDARLSYDFSETDLPSTYPKATARLLLYLGNLPLSLGASMDLRDQGTEIIDNLLTLTYDFSDDMRRDLEDLWETLG